MFEWLGALDDMQSASISAIATAVSAAAAVMVALLTVLLLLENRRLRKAGNSPELVAYLMPHPDGHGGVNFILANVGTGPAFNVTFELVGDDADLTAHDALIKNDPERSPFSVIPQNERIVALFGVSFVLYGKTREEGNNQPLRPFNVKIAYEDGFGRTRKSLSPIDIKQFSGLAGMLSKPSAVVVADSLRSMDKHLAIIARQSSNYIALVDTTKFADEFNQKVKGQNSS